MLYTITMFYAGLLGLVLLALSVRVVYLRRGLKVGLGSGGNDALERAVRAHANFCEYVPIALLLILLLEASAAVSGWLLHILGIGLVAGRVLHGMFGLNLSSGVSAGRLWGTALTWLVIGASALLCVGMAIGRWLHFAS